jgi:hypothetical protein
MVPSFFTSGRFDSFLGGVSVQDEIRKINRNDENAKWLNFILESFLYRARFN